MGSADACLSSVVPELWVLNTIYETVWAGIRKRLALALIEVPVLGVVCAVAWLASAFAFVSIEELILGASLLVADARVSHEVPVFVWSTVSRKLLTIAAAIFFVDVPEVAFGAGLRFLLTSAGDSVEVPSLGAEVSI